MKKTKILEALLAGALALLVSGFTFTSCSNAAGNDDNGNGSGSGSGGNQSGRTKIEGKIGEYGYPYEVGDIVYKDGSATPYSSGLELTDSQKAAAIAVIFYKGNQLNSDDEEGNAVTDKERILGVGLEQRNPASLFAYCRWSYGNGERKISSVECSVRGEVGNWVISGDKDGHDNLYQIAKELGSDNDVYVNGDKYYEAFAFARNYAKNEACVNLKNTAFESDWYLPSIAELYYLWKKAAVVNAASKLCGGKTFGESEAINSHDYWSSSQAADEAKAYLFSFDMRESHLFDGELEAQEKSDGTSCNVCAIRDFTEGAAAVPAIPRPSAREGQLGKYGKPYELNDILLTDGSVIPYESGLTLTAEQKAAVEANIFYAGKDKFDETSAFTKILGIGLEESSAKLKWCTSEAYYYSRSLERLECEVSGKPGSYTFTGTVHGDTNLSNLDAANYYYDKNELDEKYPALWFGGKDDPVVIGNQSNILEDYWYLPTIAEMFYVWKVKDLINPTLEVCGGTKLKIEEKYWSSSQSTSQDSSALSIDMNNGTCFHTNKTAELYARMIHEY